MLCSIFNRYLSWMNEWKDNVVICTAHMNICSYIYHLFDSFCVKSPFFKLCICFDVYRACVWFRLNYVYAPRLIWFYSLLFLWLIDRRNTQRYLWTDEFDRYTYNSSGTKWSCYIILWWCVKCCIRMFLKVILTHGKIIAWHCSYYKFCVGTQQKDLIYFINLSNKIMSISNKIKEEVRYDLHLYIY